MVLSTGSLDAGQQAAGLHGDGVVDRVEVSDAVHAREVHQERAPIFGGHLPAD
jgi:hypothetical protein